MEFNRRKVIKNDEDYLISRTYTNYGGRKMNEYYKCAICGKLKKKDNILGNYENYICDECYEKYCISVDTKEE